MIELLSADEMQAVDAAAIKTGLDSYQLMQAAARGVSDSIINSSDPTSRVVVVAGSGNNGGDGALVASALLTAGYPLNLLRFAADKVRNPDALRAFASYTGDVQHIETADDISTPDSLGYADIIVDAMFGAGLSRTPDGIAASLIAGINDSAAFVYSIDLPSGVDGNCKLEPSVAVQADITITFVRYKTAHVLMPFKGYCGELQLKQIGIPASILPDKERSVYLNMPRLWRQFLKPPKATDHKFKRGHVLVVGGGAGNTGASRLSAQTALQCGAGVVTLACGQDAISINASHLTAVMLSCVNNASELAITLAGRRINSVIVGPGNGVSEHTRQCVEASLASGKHCVLDADALSAFEASPMRLRRALQQAAGMVVLTPHEGEFRRIFADVASNDCSRLHLAKMAADSVNAIIVYKGCDTIVAAAYADATINTHAPPWLATAGAGDVLAGLIGALLAQGLQAYDAANAAVWLHSEAARQLGYPLTAEQLVSATGAALGATVSAGLPELPAGLS